MENEKKLYKATLVFVRRPGQILLATKEKLIGAGLLNGYGGEKEEGETFEECAVRELFSETRSSKTSRMGILAKVEDLKKVAIGKFYKENKDGSVYVNCECHIYFVDKWQGTAESTDEMKDPQWFGIAVIPFDRMLPDDKIFLTEILLGKKIVFNSYRPVERKPRRPIEITEVSSFE
jgi:8-oxo-dGTP diphosphatase